MKVHKVTLFVVDHENLGADEVKTVLEDTRYPNWCMTPNVLGIETREIGEWEDNHPLNNSASAPAEIERLFGDKPL